ncbi:hypothetical protein [Alcanivorax jadensis]|uniref:hypothetical protein n=1 Tax=Alcanivorax jadensis TaxID=64988 RepID=UPI00235740AD|nr:hypothetical protein [Alcanivorax jadensis]
MAVIIYTARRGVISGHTAGEAYEMEVGIESVSPSFDREENTLTTLSGKDFTTFYRIEERDSFSTVAIDDVTLLAQMREFLMSVAAGEPFTLDLMGEPGSPVAPVSYKLRGNPAKRLVNSAGFYSYSWQVKVFDENA